MEMILLDWTRMGKSYCLAGVILQENGQLKTVRPLRASHSQLEIRNVGWPLETMEGKSRWDVFELVNPKATLLEAPHLEDLWVDGLKPRGKLNDLARRKAILEGTLRASSQPWFGVPLATTRSAAYLTPGTGSRSLTSVLVSSQQITFFGSWCRGKEKPDFRVTLGIPGLQHLSLPVKDHSLLRRAETSSDHIVEQLQEMTRAVQQMGEWVLARLGLSRGFASHPSRLGSVCWLMADGFFSFQNPQC